MKPKTTRQWRRKKAKQLNEALQRCLMESPQLTLLQLAATFSIFSEETTPGPFQALTADVHALVEKWTRINRTTGFPLGE